MKMSFTLCQSPFPRWWGPYSPARGDISGFRFHRQRLGTWVQNGEDMEFWPVVDSPGVRLLTRTVLERWGSGRVLFLPNGYVVKPLQKDTERGKRVLLGSFNDPVVLEQPSGKLFDMSNPGPISPGDVWPGPKTVGLECIIQPDGALICKWYHPTAEGREDQWVLMTKPNDRLVMGFRTCRQGNRFGRVRVTANGHIITNCKEGGDTWISRYVGSISHAQWKHCENWIGKGYL